MAVFADSAAAEGTTLDELYWPYTAKYDIGVEVAPEWQRRHQGPLLPRLVLGRRHEQYSELVHRLCAREVDGEAEEGVDRGRRPRVGRRPAGARVAVDLRPRRAHGDPRHVERPVRQLRDGGLRRGRRRPRHGGGRRSGNGRPRRRPHRGGGLRPRLLDDHEGARRPRVRRHGVFGVAPIDAATCRGRRGRSSRQCTCARSWWASRSRRSRSPPPAPRAWRGCSTTPRESERALRPRQHFG